MFEKISQDEIPPKRRLRRVAAWTALAAAFGGCGVGLAGCSGAEGTAALSGGQPALEHQDGGTSTESEQAVDFDHELDSYQPLKKTYNFYFTYKMVHPWWDAVALGLEDAAQQYADRGIVIEYEYLAPNDVSAQDQIKRLSEASSRGFDVIGVDVADVDIVTPVVNELIRDGHKVMTFSSSDASREDGCERIAYVGNTHNREDGADLTEALCEKLQYVGKTAVLVGTKGAPCHEERALGVQDVIEKYPGMSVIETAYDGDSVENAYELTQDILERHSDLDGIICCNMSNSVGAARAVIEAGRQEDIVIVGMDHDQEALQYLRDGIIYALGVQDCYSIGFDTVQVAVKIADGCLPGEEYPEKTQEITTIIYQEGAAAMLQTLYGEIE